MSIGTVLFDTNKGNRPLFHTEWSSSDESVAIVKNGKIKALSKGVTVVSAINNGRKMDCEIYVYNVPKFDLKMYSVKPGESVAATLTKDENLTEYSTPVRGRQGTVLCLPLLPYRILYDFLGNPRETAWLTDGRIRLMTG